MAMCHDLPPELLDHILKRLPLPKVLSLGAVCKAWADASRRCKMAFSNVCSLVLMHPTQRICTIISVTDDIRKPFDLPSVFPTSLSGNWNRVGGSYRVLGSCHGWLAMMIKRTGCLSHGFLWNLLTKELIDLPPIPQQWQPKVVLSSPPTDPSCVALAIDPLDAWLWKLSDNKSWTKVKGLTHVIIRDVAVVGDKFYLLDSDRVLWIIKLVDHHWYKAFKLEINNLAIKVSSGRKHYLVESDGELLLVLMDDGLQEEAFLIFCLDYLSMQWVEQKRLEDRVFFISKNSTGSMSAAAAGCKGNRIYFTTNCNKDCHYFDMEDGVTKPCISWSEPMIIEWLAPRLG